MPHCDSRKSAYSGQSGSGVPIEPSPLKMETTIRVLTRPVRASIALTENPQKALYSTTR